MTDPGKRSKAGDLTLVRCSVAGDGLAEYKTVRRDDVQDGWSDALVEVYRDGEVLVDFSLKQIRVKIDDQLKHF